jgi:hypothetical protein
MRTEAAAEQALGESRGDQEAVREVETPIHDHCRAQRPVRPKPG